MIDVTCLGNRAMLGYVEEHLPKLLEDESAWKSLDITHKEPHIHGIYRSFGEGCIYFHKIFGCDTQKAYMHSHRWPSATRLLAGQCTMRLGFKTDKSMKIICTQVLHAPDVYEMCDPLGYHSVSPWETAFTLMVTGVPFKDAIERPEEHGHTPKELNELDRKAMFELARLYYPKKPL